MALSFDLAAYIHQPWFVGFGISVLLLLLGTTSGLINSRLWFSEPIACAAFGMAIGPFGFGVIRLDPMTDPGAALFLREAARLTLAIAVLAAAMRLPKGWLALHWPGLGVALGPGMVMMWAAGAAILRISFGLPWIDCVLIGAIVSPTDPVLSAPIVGGELAHRTVPADLRHAITAESAVNDGLAGPIVMLPLLLLQAPAAGIRHGLWLWFISVVLWQTISAIVLGAGAGFLAGKLLNWAERQIGVERSSLLTIALALALTTLCGLQAIGSNGVLGAFAAGAVLANTHESQAEEQQEHFNEAITRFFDLPIMVLLGATLPWQAWRLMGWQAPIFITGILLFRRMPAWLLLRRWMPWARRLPDNLFAGWFGPVGAAAMFYALDAQHGTGLIGLWPIVSLAVFASVLVHGVTGTHFSIWRGRRRA